MLRQLALLTILAIAGVVVAACGDDDSSSPSPSSSVPTISGLPDFTLSVTPTAAPGTPTPVPSLTPWQISGQLTGTPDMGVFSCSPRQGYYQVLLRGDFEGKLLNILVYSPNTGTHDYADAATKMTVSVQLGSTAEDSSLWFEAAGNRGVQGTIVLNADGTGSLSGVLVPPSLTTPGGASSTVTVSGEWKCPPISLG